MQTALLIAAVLLVIILVAFALTGDEDKVVTARETYASPEPTYREERARHMAALSAEPRARVRAEPRARVHAEPRTRVHERLRNRNCNRVRNRARNRVRSRARTGAHSHTRLRHGAHRTRSCTYTRRPPSQWTRHLDSQSAGSPS